MEFIDEVKANAICSKIMKSVDDVHTVDINFTVDEVIALYNVAFEVYNAFCNNSDEPDGLSVNMNRFLDDLLSATKKLTW